MDQEFSDEGCSSTTLTITSEDTQNNEFCNKSSLWLHNLDTPFSAFSNQPFPSDQLEETTSCIAVAESHTSDKKIWEIHKKIINFIPTKISGKIHSISQDVRNAITQNHPQNLKVKAKRTQSIFNKDKITPQVSAAKKILKRGKRLKIV